MARTNVPLIDGTQNQSNIVTPVAIDATNNHEIDTSTAFSDIIIQVVGDTDLITAQSYTLTFKAGVGSEAIYGDLSVTILDHTYSMITIESARFKQSNGKILIDVSETGALIDATIAVVATY